MPGPYAFKQIFAADPSNTSNVAKGGSILLFAPGDASRKPLVLTDLANGMTLPNPVPINSNGFGPAFLHETLAQVAWEGGGFSGTFESFEGLRADAIAAVAASQASAQAAGDARVAAEAAAGNAAEAAAGELAGAVALSAAEATAAKTAAQAAAGLVGAPAGAAVLAAIQPGGAAHGALSGTIGDQVAPIQAAVAAKLDSDGFTNVALPRFRAAVAKTRAGSQDTKVLFVGDSLKWGVGAGGPTKSMPAKFADLAKRYFSTANGLQVPPSNLPGANAPDPRWVAGAGWGANGNGFGLGSTFMGQPGGGSLIFTPGTGTFDRFDVYLIRQGADNATVTATVNGGTPVVIPISGSDAITKTTLTGAASSTHAVTFSGVTNGAAFVVGVEPYLSTVKTVRIGNAGVPSSTTADWTTMRGGYGPLECIKAHAADLTWIALGVNDAFIGTPTTVSAYKANIQALINAAKINGDVVLQTCIPVADAPSMITQAGYNAALAELAAENNIPLADPAGRIISHAASNTLGLYADTVHLNEAGYTDEAAGYMSLIGRVI